MAVVVRLPRRREIIEQVGLPRAELFWWAEDTEYLQWRIPEAGYPIRVVGDAFVRHDSIRHGEGSPVWKYYYEARNMLYVHMYVKRRVGRFPRNVSKLIGRAIVREDEGRVKRVMAIAQGLQDGARGNWACGSRWSRSASASNRRAVPAGSAP